jgi:Glyoxalase superfamily protein
MSLGKTTPILRIFDEAKAKEFCQLSWLQDRLGASFEASLPLYMQISKGFLRHPSLRAPRRLQSGSRTQTRN